MTLTLDLEAKAIPLPAGTYLLVYDNECLHERDVEDVRERLGWFSVHVVLLGVHPLDSVRLVKVETPVTVMIDAPPKVD